MNLNETSEKPARCKGAVFRADVQHFTTKRGGLAFSVRLNKVKRLSCPGCDVCQGWAEHHSEIGNDWPVVGIETAQDKKLYTLEPCNESRDWETGYIDSWDFELVEYTPDPPE